MNAHHKVIPVIAGSSSILMIAVSLAFISQMPWSNLVTRHEARTEVRGDVAILNPASALSDMRAHAAHHLAAHTEVPGSFGSSDEWSPGWHLQWIDVEHDGGTVRVYHATNVRKPQERFIAIWNAEHTVWEQVR